MKHLTFAFSLLVAVFLTSCCCTKPKESSSAPARPKLIDLSWNIPTVDFLEKYLAEIEETTPFDGLTIAAKGTTVTVNGAEFKPWFWSFWGNTPMKYEYFEDFVKRINQLKFTKCKDNFFYLTTNEAKFDWFSDKDWEIVAANFGIAAKVSKAVGFKGFLLDIEEYGMPMWGYDTEKAERPFAEASLVAYQRGQQWGKAVFKEFPDIILFMPFSLSMSRWYEFSQKSHQLFSSFLNGIIDVMPPQAKIYEGEELASYNASNPEEFRNLRNNLQSSITRYVFAKNRAKMQKQFKLTPGFYIDSYFYLPPENGWVKGLQPELDAAPNRVVFFCNNLASAYAVADDYVWLYSEHRCWWNRHGDRAPQDELWDEAPGAQGLTDAIRSVRVLHNEAK